MSKDKKQKAEINIENQEEDRYSRLRLIPWWDQERLKKAKVMVVGAGALGNEIVKNLALLGIGYIFIVDMDRIENSNLSRSVLYRASDEGSYKADVAAKMAMEINPDILAVAFCGNVIYDLGLGVFRAMDVIIGGLDNREARLAINQACWKVNRPFIDGAIEILHGFARVFIPPDSACYECTMNETDYQLLNVRKSCAMLNREEMQTGKVPTTPTTASIIAGIEVQEAIKILHNNRKLPVLKGKGIVYNGLTHDSYVVEYTRKEDCLSHETFQKVEKLNFGADSCTVKELIKIIKNKMGDNAVLDLGREIVISLKCSNCQKDTLLFKQLGKVTESQGKCSFCNNMRHPLLSHSLDGSEDFLEMTLKELGVPDADILTGRIGFEMLHFELAKDLKKFSL